MVTHLLLAMSAPSQFAVLVMSMSGKMGLSVVPNAKLGTGGTKVSFFVIVFKMLLHI